MAATAGAELVSPGADSVAVKSGHLADWHQVPLRFFGPVALTALTL
jgi:hypothetical protein